MVGCHCYFCGCHNCSFRRSNKKRVAIQTEHSTSGSKRTLQIYNNVTYVYHRLIVKNARKADWLPWLPNQAKEARVSITYRELPKGSGFIPIPLRWTHFNTIYRDIPPGEEVYVDIIGKKADETKYRFCWAPNVGPGGEELDYFDATQGDLRLEFYEQNQKIGDIYLKFDTKSDLLVPL